jgi:Mrp family chromosome partitioning ATPase
MVTGVCTALPVDYVEVATTCPPAARGTGLDPELIAYHQPDHATSQQYRELLSPLLALASATPGKAFLFTTARPECRATTVLLNVAITAAAQVPLNVVVVEGNWRQPGLAERLGLADRPGLRDVLSGALSLERACQETEQANLIALPAGTAPPRQGVRFQAQTVRSLLRQLRQRFDLVLVDGPPWDGQPDVVLFGAACDAVLLVVGDAEAETPQVDELSQTIAGRGARLAGCILAGA